VDRERASGEKGPDLFAHYVEREEIAARSLMRSRPAGSLPLKLIETVSRAMHVRDR